MAQKLYIPNLGTMLILAEDWNFRCFFERRNAGILDAALKPYISEALSKRKYFRWNSTLQPENFSGGKFPSIIEYERPMSEDQLKGSFKSYRVTNSDANPFIRVTLPKGTQLKVDRIYIRQGGESFASVSFRTTKICGDKRFVNKRFWVKLNEANEIFADILG